MMTTVEKRTFGSTIRNKRQAQGLSISELSRMSGVPKTTISDIENQRHAPRFETLKALVEALS